MEGSLIFLTDLLTHGMFSNLIFNKFYPTGQPKYKCLVNSFDYTKQNSQPSLYIYFI